MPTRVVSIENRVFNTFENRAAALSITSGTVSWFVHTLNTIGSGSVKNLTCVIDGFYKQAGQTEANLPAGMVINKMHLQIVGEPTVPLTMGGSRSYTVTPGEVNTEGDLITAAQLKSTLSMLPIGTEYWFKAEGTIPWNGALPSSVRHKDDATNTQFGWFNPANTVLVNGVDVGGPFTWTGTTPDFRNNGWCPWQFVGNYEDGTDPVTEMFVGDSNTQGLQDSTAKRTGRGWPQYLLFGDGTSSPSTGIRSGSNMGISGDSGVSLSTATKIHSKAKYHTDYWVNTGANDLGKAGVGSVTTTHNARMTIKNALITAWVGSRTPKVIFPQFHPQSTIDSPTKTINSAPNTEWGPGGKASQVNALAAAAVLAGDIYGYAQSPSIRNGNDINDIEYYLWLKNAPPAIGTLLSPDGQHAGNNGVILIAQDFTPLYRSITAGSTSDTVPDSFTFTAATGVAVSTLSTSNTVTIGGIDAATPISIVNGEYSINSGAWVTASGTITNGQTVAVRRTSSSSTGTTVTAVLTIGGVDGTYSVSTVGAADTTPDSFTFTAATGVAISTLTTSNTVTIGGIDSAASVSIANGEYSINGAAFTTSSGTITNGQTVAVRRTSSASNSTTVTAVLTIGGVNGTFSVTTVSAAADTTPNAFSFTAQTGVGVNTLATSNSVAIGGIDAPSPISITSGEYSINGGAFTTASGTINNGNSVVVRRVSSGSNSTAVTAVLSIGGVSGTFSVTTVAPGSDNVPDAFAFSTLINAAISTTYVSDIITVTGTDTSSAISIANGEYSLNGGTTWVTASGTVNLGSTVVVRRVSSGTFNTAVLTTLTIGGVTGAFTIITASSQAAYDAGQRFTLKA